MISHSSCFNFLLLLIVYSLVSCSAEHSAEPGDTIKETEILSKISSGEPIYFDYVYNNVLKTNCLECHKDGNSLGNVNLSTYLKSLGDGTLKSTITPFQPEASSFYSTLTLLSGQRMMPPKSKPRLKQSQIKLVYYWIKNGALGTDLGGSAPIKSIEEKLQPFFNNPETIDYNVVDSYIFKNHCMECHSFEGSKADHEGAILYGQDMTNYGALLLNNGIVADKISDYVVSENGKLRKKKGSRVYKSMAIQQTMPPTNEGYKLVDSHLIKLLRLWIINCAIEDYPILKQHDTLLDDDSPKRKNGKVRHCQ